MVRQKVPEKRHEVRGTWTALTVRAARVKKLQLSLICLPGSRLAFFRCCLCLGCLLAQGNRRQEELAWEQRIGTVVCNPVYQHHTAGGCTSGIGPTVLLEGDVQKVVSASVALE